MQALTWKWIEYLHPAIWVIESRPAELTVEAVGVAGYESPAAQALQVWMTVDGLHQPFAETLGAIIFVDEYVTKIGEDGIIADDARQTDLFFAVIEAEDKRIFEGAFSAFVWASLCPIGAREHIGDGTNIETRGVGADDEIVTLDFDDLWHSVSVS